jgi:NTP pyrophosphatase (non-canonical NTP hydrolase)
MDDYIKKATRTESMDLFSVENPRLLHAAIGIMTESAELLLAPEGDTTNVKEELGDVLWYVAIAADEMQVTFDQLKLLGDEIAQDHPLRYLLGSAGSALDVIKRGLFYGITIDTRRLGKNLGSILLAIEVLAEAEGWTMSDLQEANIAKLTKRFPDKFTTEAAVNRDVEAEREVL